jgi:hypothetical protein
MQGVRGWLCVLGRDGSLLPLTVADFSPCRAVLSIVAIR